MTTSSIECKIITLNSHATEQKKSTNIQKLLFSQQRMKN